MLHSPSMLTHSRINQKKIFMTRRDSTYFYFEIIPVCCSSPCVLVITNSIISLSFIISQIDFWNDIVNFNDLEISQFKKKTYPFLFHLWPLLWLWTFSKLDVKLYFRYNGGYLYLRHDLTHSQSNYLLMTKSRQNKPSH